MPLSSDQISRLHDGHHKGMLDHELARHANMSISSVKRYRNKHGLKTNCETTKRGTAGEETVAFLAQERGLTVEWPRSHNGAYDLRINNRRVDCKAAMQEADGQWRFRLSSTRRSFYGKYQYAKDYAADCDVIALVCFQAGATPADPDIYFLESTYVPTEIRIRTGGQYEEFKDAWAVFDGLTSPALQA
jgi:hypothetical protein